MRSITGIVSCAYKDTLGDKITATKKYGLGNVHVEKYTDVIGLCAQLISAKLKKHYYLQFRQPQKLQCQE